jgi:hypothetical protein
LIIFNPSLCEITCISVFLWFMLYFLKASLGIFICLILSFYFSVDPYPYSKFGFQSYQHTKECSERV